MRAEILLPLHLGVQVSLYIAELQEKGGPDAADFLLAQQTGQAIAAKGDRLLYRCGKKGETAALVSELAFCIAVLSFLPGGVTVFGRRWEGGLSLEPYGSGWTEMLREQIRERGGRICQLCGTPESENDGKLSIHHIDYSKTNHALSNLVALCRGCHTKTGYDRAKWRSFFANMVEQQEKTNEKDNSIG